MITIDGIIFSLQAYGGITVCFNELLCRLASVKTKAELLVYRPLNLKSTDNFHLIVRPRRNLERYRPCDVSVETKIFHSSYYRVPHNSSTKIVTTVHDFTYERFASGMRRKLHSWQKFKAIRASDAIICISESTKNDLLHFLPEVEQEKIFVIPNGVSTEFFPLHGAGPKLSDPCVVFVGARGGYKNFIVTIQALSMLPKIKLLCVGGGNFTSKERELLDKNIPGRYRHAGMVSNAELNTIYNNMLCLVYPSSYEGFGLPVLEAMRAGCPVIAINTSSIPEVAGSAALLVDKPDADAIAHSIESFLSPLNRDSFVSKGLSQASLFSWDKNFNGILDVYGWVQGNHIAEKR